MCSDQRAQSVGMMTMAGFQTNGYACQSDINHTSHGIFCEEGFPYPRCQLQNILVGMCLNALQDINQVDAWIDLIQQGLNDSQFLPIPSRQHRSFNTSLACSLLSLS